MENSPAVIQSVSEQTGLATVELLPTAGNKHLPRYSDVVQVPLSRLRPPRNEVRKTGNKISIKPLYNIQRFMIRKMMRGIG